MNGSMNDLKEEKGTREELRRSQAAPRRSGGGLKRALMVILALAGRGRRRGVEGPEQP